MWEDDMIRRPRKNSRGSLSNFSVNSDSVKVKLVKKRFFFGWKIFKWEGTCLCIWIASITLITVNDDAKDKVFFKIIITVK